MRRTRFRTHIKRGCLELITHRDAGLPSISEQTNELTNDRALQVFTKTWSRGTAVSLTGG
jgi:hypothetical protein